MKVGGVLAAAGVVLSALILAACGSSPSAPSPPPSGNGGGVVTPPSNNPPTIQSITVQGTRSKEPANFADLGEMIAVTADVKDDETPVAQLTYNWSATAGTFSGTGASVTWQAPTSASAPTDVTLTLEVVEKYGTAPSTLQNTVSSTATVSLHDSPREVGDMSRQFLLDFSDSSLTDLNYIMRNFGGGSTCPNPQDVDNEFSDVKGNRRDFKIVSSRIGSASVSTNFGGSCSFRGRRGDACATVPSYWESIEVATGLKGAVDGNDIVSAAYAPSKSRWFLCASDYDGRKASGATLHGFLRMQ